MIYRKANIPINVANAVFATENLLEKVKEILRDEKSVYKILKFCRPEVMERWEMSEDQENAEMIAKYIVRMGTRTTINQLFGILMSDKIENKELFLLAPEFYQELKDKILFEDLDREDIVFTISSQLEESNVCYTSYHCYGGIRKEIVLRKGTLIGDLVQFIVGKSFVSGKDILRYGRKMNVSESIMLGVTKTLYQLGCLYSNINIELFGYDANKEYEIFSAFLQEKDKGYLRKVLQKTDELKFANVNDFFMIKAEIEETVGLLLGKKSDRRIVNGYSRKNCKCKEEEKNDFRMSRILKRFFTCLGMITPEYVEMQQFEERFVDKYGLFCYVSLKEALKLYRKATVKENKTYEKQREIMIAKIREAELNKQEVLNLSTGDLEEICNLENSERGLRTFPIELDIKYQCWQQNIVMSEMTFAYAGAFCNAYLRDKENNVCRENLGIRYMDCCPESMSLS